jgi:hypothetical protein
MLHSALVIGCGRSGTSMAAGTLAGAGYFMGERLHPARHSNPKGFFESGEINQINEALLTPLVPARPEVPKALRQGQRWLAEVPLDAAIPPPQPDVARRMERAVAQRPFCFKDPRFCYTLPVWRPLLGGAVMLCVFRHPAISAQSIVKECRDMENLHNLEMDFARAVAVWSCMYRHVIALHRHQGRWLFVEFQQFFEPGALERIGRFIGSTIDAGFPQQTLRRTRSERHPGPEALAIYEELADLAGFRPSPANHSAVEG